jgi:hypothetical protein
VIGYYLRHRAEVDAYIAERELRKEQLYRELEPTNRAFHERLLARRKERELGLSSDETEVSLENLVISIPFKKSE